MSPRGMDSQYAPRICRHPGCERVLVRAGSGGPGEHLCSVHDGHHGPPVCMCSPAIPDEFDQCVRCWRPVVSLRPILHGPAVRVWPELADQPIDWSQRKTAT